MTLSRRRTFKAFLITALLFFANSLSLRAQNDSFYNGKTVRDHRRRRRPAAFTIAGRRPLSRYIPKYIAGNPNFVVQNMPGASSVVAANYVYNLPKPDGLTVVMPINSLHLDQIVGRQEVKYDMRKLNTSVVKKRRRR